ncbi:MAG: selenocysteine-specific translation elongation factor [Syntrophaceae bacterium]
MKRVVIGTAGHVDHGKTSLIKALTGVDCDRLKEEKERGMTTELGFTSLKLPSGEQVGVVDVPGHVRFIRHMLSGASGIDLVVLVVAADEGIMPQTTEHIQICELLGIQRGVVALTKIDMVDAELFELALSDVKAFLEGSFLKDAPIIPVSSVTGEGIAELLAAIDRQVSEVRERELTGIAALPIDRIFTIKGFGTVVTGTLVRGRFAMGEDVEILPHGVRAKIRTLQVHDRQVHEALAGMRTAVNLQGVDKEQLDRGAWLVPAGVFTPTKVIDARVKLFNAPRRGGIRIHIGTAEVLGTLVLHEVDGQQAARIRLREKIVAAYGDRFIIRSISPGETLGGGMVLNSSPHRRFSAEVVAGLLDENPGKHIEALVRDAGVMGIAKREIHARLAEGGSLEKTIQDLLTKGEIIRFDTQNDLFVAGDHFQMLKDVILNVVHDYHDKNPTSPGISKEHLRSSLKGAIEPRLFHKGLLELSKAGRIVEEGPHIRERDFSASLGTDGELSEEIYTLFDQAGLEPPSPAELARKHSITEKRLSQVLGFMSRQGRLVKIKDDIYLTDRHEAEIKARVKAFLQSQTVMKPGDMKTIAGVSRKFAIPYMEYLDRIKFTLRVGDERKLFMAG